MPNMSCFDLRLSSTYFRAFSTKHSDLHTMHIT